MLGARFRHKAINLDLMLKLRPSSLPDELFGIIGDSVAPPGDMLVGARNNQLVARGLGFGSGHVDDDERDAVRAHRFSQGRNRDIRVVAQKGVAGAERIIDGPSVG